MRVAGLLVFYFVSFVLGRPSITRPTWVVRSARDVPPEGFRLDMGTTQGDPLRLTIGLPQNNITGLQKALLDVSDPDSPNYGRYWSHAEIGQHVAPKQESLKAVTDWLSENGISPTSTSTFGDMLHVHISVAKANTLLKANYVGYVHEASNTTMTRTLSFSLPADVQDHISFVYPTTHFIPPATRGLSLIEVPQHPNIRSHSKPESKRALIPVQCAKVVTPACLQMIYNIPSAPAAASPKNSLFVSGFQGEVADGADLQTFLFQNRPDILEGVFSVTTSDGGSNNGQGTLEANLDIQYTVGLATNVPTTFVAVGKDNHDDLGGFIDLLDGIINDPPLVITTSYGFDESAVAHDPQLAHSLCNAAAQLGMLGTTVLFSSGDGGVAGILDTVDANRGCAGGAFVPTFPSGCPYLTSVGATQGINPETASPFSSGGFSNIFARPAYQTPAVSAYLDQQAKPPTRLNTALFEARGRAYPDVAAQGANIQLTLVGKPALANGTSASSPIFASVVALLNDARLQKKLPPLGFLNPLLYSRGAAVLNDITRGSNPGCNTPGFPAAVGWDPVTGMGTPDYLKLRALVAGVAR